MANNYKVSGKKLTSRFGMSHSQTKATTKWMKGGEPRQPGDRKYPLSKRLAKKCKHKRWIDAGHCPDCGCDAGYCRDCGYGFHIRMY